MTSASGFTLDYSLLVWASFTLVLWQLFLNNVYVIQVTSEKKIRRCTIFRKHTTHHARGSWQNCSTCIDWLVISSTWRHAPAGGWFVLIIVSNCSTLLYSLESVTCTRTLWQQVMTRWRVVYVTWTVTLGKLTPVNQSQNTLQMISFMIN